LGGGAAGGSGKKDAEVTQTVYFDISIDGAPKGRIEMGLFGSEVREFYLWHLPDPSRYLISTFTTLS
jgi:hypothetical protein